MDKIASRPRATRRKRVSRACELCRARKIRCDGRRPSCSACSMAQSPCRYGSGMKKRGLPTGYVRSLELLWALVFTVVPNSMSIVNELIPEIQFALDSHAKLVMVSRLVGDPDVLRQAWENSGIQTELDHLLPTASDNINMVTTPARIGEQLESTVDLPHFTVRSFEAIQSGSTDGGRPISDPITWLEDTNKAETPSPQRISMVNEPSPEDVGSTVFPQHARRLLDLYFAHTHCWLPMVQRHKMYEIMYSSSPAAIAEAGSLATFWAILAYASLQESREPFGPASAPDNHGVFLAPEQIYAKARQQIPNEEAQEPDYVQALLILSLFRMYRGEFAKAWHLIGQAVRLSLDLGTLPADSSGSSSAAGGGNDDKQTRQLLSCFVLDTVVSCHLGKPPHLRTVDIRSLPPPVETGPDEWEPRTVCLAESEYRRRSTYSGDHQPQRAMSIFNCYVGVIRILNDAMSDPISEEAFATHSSALSRWHHQLPPHCVFSLAPGQSHAQGLSLQLINLHLAFKSTEMLLKAQQASTPRLRPSPSTPGTEVSSIAIMRLISAFATNFRVSTMPAVFGSYKAISDRKVTQHGFVDSNSQRTRANPSRSCQPPALSSGLASSYLPTPVDNAGCALTGVSGIISNFGLPSSCEARGESPVKEKTRLSIPNAMNEDEKEVWEEIFDAVDVGEGGVSNFSYHGALDYLNGMKW
ncbi:hypothetical protein B0J13DRAFT_644059 [Dactylonectria estremocensis]|uniref:Zn(2)-C6 fungal-type domain-containing protein n=1 Tax=Dactylonectria estremocensis TaxID=1079267 RepID=A0A9P9FGB2_9HYPO|nr:hypothetical protein B0J13DRAFT_644059 [Dactylonectria estremocensis]